MDNADTFLPSGLIEQWFAASACPGCGRRPLRSVEAGGTPRWLCPSCGRCYHAEHGHLVLSDPLTCEGCGRRERDVCIAAMRLRERGQTSIITTIAVTLAVCALVIGMAVLTAVVTDNDDGGSTAASTAAPVAAFTDAPTTIDFGATWDDAFVARDPSLPPAPAQTVHELEMTATEIELPMAPGHMQLMWTFNDQVPGPTLRGKVGDIFRITLRNEGTLPHSIDFHASKVAWNDEMRSINPGATLVYEYEAKHAGIFMYHCGTAPTLHHIGMGMYGTIIIDPPDLAPVDHEFVFVQSELYEAPPGAAADMAKMAADKWDAIMFNGAVNQYRDRPIVVPVGARIRAWVMDDGPSENMSFHVVGTVFDTVFKEGTYILRPDAGRGGAQALDLQPAQGGFVEFTLDEEGLYPFVTHKFSNVGKGALGLFQAGDGLSDTPALVLDADGQPVPIADAPAASH